MRKKAEEMNAPATLRIDLTGDTFGSWTVLHWSHRGNYNKQYWLCRCTCGKQKEVESYNLLSGRSRSCRPCSATAAAKALHKHGLSGTRIYNLWRNIKQRCLNPNARSWRRHGALGVRMAPEWVDDPVAFAAYVGEPPTHLHTIGRIDRQGDYVPGNVGWMMQCEAKG